VGLSTGPFWLANDQLQRRLARRAADDRLSGTEQGPPRQLATSSEWAELEDLWSRRYELLRALRSVPRTLCHGDFHRANLIETGPNETVVVDWGQLGTACPGEAIAQLVLSISWMTTSARRLRAAERLVVGAYLESMAGAVAAVDVQLAYLIAIILGYLSRLRWAVRHDGLTDSLSWWRLTCAWIVSQNRRLNHLLPR
jgi:hypothetical protein